MKIDDLIDKLVIKTSGGGYYIDETMTCRILLMLLEYLKEKENEK